MGYESHLKSVIAFATLLKKDAYGISNHYLSPLQSESIGRDQYHDEGDLNEEHLVIMTLNISP